MVENEEDRGGGEGAIDIKDAWSPCLPCMRKSNLGKCWDSLQRCAVL